MYNIIGRGTAGIIAVINCLIKGKEVNWYYDSSIKPVRVGEGTLNDIPFLFNSLGLNTEFLKEINATYKMGLFKSGWSKNDFYDSFAMGYPGMHMSAVDLQDKIFELLITHPFIKKVEDTHISSDNLEGFTIDCSGTPDIDENFYSTKIPVNNAYVTQCKWGNIRMDFSLTIARPYGWVFGIPLQDRVSIGYLFNDKFNNLEDIKEDVKYIFNRFNLTPTEDTNHIKFSNYYRKKNFKDNLAYCGNKSFFLEPLEATSLSCSYEVTNIFLDEFTSTFVKNNQYKSLIKKAENVIMLHYLSKNDYKTDFWKFARENALEHFDGKDLDYIKRNCLFFDSNKVDQHIRELEINIV